MIHVHSYFCYREEKTQFITYFIRHLFPCDPHCNEFFVKIKIPWFSRGHPRFDRHFVFLSPFQYRGPYFNLVKTLLSKKNKILVQICSKERIVKIMYNVQRKTSRSDPTPVKKHPDPSTRTKQRTVTSHTHNFIEIVNFIH